MHRRDAAAGGLKLRVQASLEAWSACSRAKLFERSISDCVCDAKKMQSFAQRATMRAIHHHKWNMYTNTRRRRSRRRRWMARRTVR